jgi:Rrf2 family transcriptional regulator, cysteine metabolism repressor
MNTLSMKARYGIKFMIHLGLNYKKGPIQINIIGERENISPKFLSQVVILLRSAGLVKGERGKNGGYLLIKNPSDITLRNIIEILEGPFENNACRNNHDECLFKERCVLHDFMDGYSLNTIKYLESITLNKLIDDYKNKNEDMIYYI